MWVGQRFVDVPVIRVDKKRNASVTFCFFVNPKQYLRNKKIIMLMKIKTST